MRDHHKASFSHPSMGAELIILDPALSVSTPERIWLSTGMRSVDHCVETLCSIDSKTGPETDKSASTGLKMLVPNLSATKREWENEEARLLEMMGVIDALKALLKGVPMGGSHAIGHQLGPLGVGHGETSCIMLPAVLKYTYAHGDEKVRANQQKVLDVLWGEETVVKILKEKGLEKGKAGAGDVLDAIIRDLGMPRTLKEVGVVREQLDKLADNCLKDRWMVTNPVPLTEKKQVLEILEMAIGDEK
jgi:alcohol dehydrogenase class IV